MPRKAPSGATPPSAAPTGSSALPKGRRGLAAHYARCSQRVRDYFEHLPALLGDFPLDVALAYVFAQVELAHNMSLYCGVVKLHRAHHDLARTAIDAHHMTRQGFGDMFEIVFGQALPAPIRKHLNDAEDIRDRVMHGKRTTAKQQRHAIANVLDYAEAFNNHLAALASLRPFGDLRGFKGRAASLDKRTTRWVLKGMGFGLS